MSVERDVKDGLRNALARRPALDAAGVERLLRRSNRSFGRKLGRIEWVGSLRAFIWRSAELMLEGWTPDYEGPLSPPGHFYGTGVGGHARLRGLAQIERTLWERERAAHSTARLSPAKRLPVYLNALEPPDFAASAATEALSAEQAAAQTPASRARNFAADQYWRSTDPHWAQTEAAVVLPFLTEASRCFAAGLFAAALLRRSAATRTLLVARPRLSLQDGRLHAADAPAVVWPDGSGSWYWQGIAVPERLAAAHDRLTAEQVAQIGNQELRRVTLERLGWERFLQTADAELSAQDDYGKLWATKVWLDGERVQLVEVVNATAEPDGSYRRYVLRVPPNTRSAREAVAWTFGFDNANAYILAAAS
jgi:Domain of unknown function (DUF6745)